MARLSSSAIRASLRSGVRSRRKARNSKAGPNASAGAATSEPRDAEPDISTRRLQVRRRRIKAARAALRRQKRRSGFGKALRTEIRTGHRMLRRRAVRRRR
ncbi:hypothetical protein [Blastomonas sp. CACIA14H2]|uniref:hypothetical protein n=1 Tax=Blastomonas sp. CACIA14H2 TaxID=1419876 RepID=UPI00405A3800